MLFLLPLIILVAANPCPYCKLDSCTFTEGSLPSCSACYDLATVVPIKIKASAANAEVAPLGVCQLCPNHCSSCVYALQAPYYARPRPVVNCTSCHSGYTTDHETGKCAKCPDNCDAGCLFKTVYLAISQPYGVIDCLGCNAGFTHNYFYGKCNACPDHCTACACQLKGCLYISCSACAPGFVLQPQQGGGSKCGPEARRLVENQASN